MISSFTLFLVLFMMGVLWILWLIITGIIDIVVTREDSNDPSLDNVRMIFEDEDGNQTLWSPADCVECGTPIDEEGQDMKYTGLCRVDANKNRNTMERSSMEPILEAKVFN